MNFFNIASKRQSCRKYNREKEVEQEKIDSVISTALLSPSACNAQPYHITVAKENSAKEIAKATMGMGMNKFTENVPVMIVISEDSYNATAAMGAKIKNNDYRSIDIGILSAFIISQAESEGLSCCMLGWFDDIKIRKICNLSAPVRLVIALGYASDDDIFRTKKRKAQEELVTFLDN